MNTEEFMHKELTLNEYQDKAMTTCMPSSENFSYMFLNLVGEVGEFASKIAKGIRKNKCQIGNIAGEPNILIPSTHIDSMTPEERLEVRKEAGDILWQLSGVCKVMGWTLEEVAQENLDKLAARKEAGTIDGNGDGIIRDK